MTPEKAKRKSNTTALSKNGGLSQELLGGGRMFQRGCISNATGPESGRSLSVERIVLYGDL